MPAPAWAAVAPLGLVDPARDYPGAHRARPSGQNGSHEQFHAVLKAETARPPARHAPPQQRRFDRFCVEYNHERPHEALARRGARELLSALAAPVAAAAAAARVSRPFGNAPRLEDRPGVVARRAWSFSPTRWRANRSPSKKSTTASGRCALPPSRSPVTTNGIARFHPIARCPRRGAPPAPLAPRLTSRHKCMTKPSINCYPCLRTNLLPMSPAVRSQFPTPNSQLPIPKPGNPNERGESRTCISESCGFHADGTNRLGLGVGLPAVAHPWQGRPPSRRRRRYGAQPSHPRHERRLEVGS